MLLLLSRGESFEVSSLALVYAGSECIRGLEGSDVGSLVCMSVLQGVRAGRKCWESSVNRAARSINGLYMRWQGEGGLVNQWAVHGAGQGRLSQFSCVGMAGLTYLVGEYLPGI